MSHIYSYVIVHDDGAAPNIAHSVCTLAICKPGIRRVAQEGDWIFATGSVKRGYGRRLVYAMKISDRVPMSGYENYCRSNKYTSKIATPGNKGDCIYTKFPKNWTANFPWKVKLRERITNLPVMMRGSVHSSSRKEVERELKLRDLSGNYVLISHDYVYFGEANSIKVPSVLEYLIHEGQAFRKHLYDPEFEFWLNQIQRNVLTSTTKLKKNIKQSSCNPISLPTGC